MLFAHNTVQMSHKFDHHFQQLEHLPTKGSNSVHPCDREPQTSHTLLGFSELQCEFSPTASSKYGRDLLKLLVQLVLNASQKLGYYAVLNFIFSRSHFLQ